VGLKPRRAQARRALTLDSSSPALRWRLPAPVPIRSSDQVYVGFAAGQPDHPAALKGGKPELVAFRQPDDPAAPIDIRLMLSSLIDDRDRCQ
jgi:hypothetical protein